MKDWGPQGKNLGSPTYQPARNDFNRDNNSVTMCMSGLYQIDRIKAQNPEFYESGEWMVVPFPVFENAVNDVRCNYYGHYYMVNAESSKEKQEYAWKFIEFYVNPSRGLFIKVGLIQPKKTLLNSDVFKNYPYANVFMSDLAEISSSSFAFKRPSTRTIVKGSNRICDANKYHTRTSFSHS